MKTILATIALTLGMTGAAHASTLDTHSPARAKASIAQHACEHGDSEGFCGLTPVRATRAPTAAMSADRSRAQLDRLIASLN